MNKNKMNHYWESEISYDMYNNKPNYDWNNENETNCDIYKNNTNYDWNSEINYNANYSENYVWDGEININHSNENPFLVSRILIISI